MLEQIFLRVVEISLASNAVIGIVCLARIFLKRFPKRFSYMLWSVVLFRLLCPIALEAEIGIVPDIKPLFHAIFFQEKTTKEPAGNTVIDTGDISESESDGLTTVSIGREAEKRADGGKAISVQPSMRPSVQSVLGSDSKDAEGLWRECFLLFGKYLWILGIGILFFYCVISVVRIRNQISVSIPLKENIYIADNAISPFAMGLLNPRIYLPEGLGEEEQEYIILHEKVHIRRFDHITKPLAFAALCIHWFNPLVWIAFILFCRDMEMSCDEAVIKKLGEGIRADYSASLLALSTRHRILQGVPVDFGEGDTKGRVRNLASFRRTKKWVSIVLSAVVVALVVSLAFTRKPFAQDARAFPDLLSVGDQKISDKMYIYYIHKNEIRKWNQTTGEDQLLYQSEGTLKCLNLYKDYFYFIEAMEEKNEHRLCSISADGENLLITRLAPVNFKASGEEAAFADSSKEPGMDRELLFQDMVENVSKIYEGQEENPTEAHYDTILVYRQGGALEIRVDNLKPGRIKGNIPQKSIVIP